MFYQLIPAWWTPFHRWKENHGLKLSRVLLISAKTTNHGSEVHGHKIPIYYVLNTFIVSNEINVWLQESAALTSKRALRAQVTQFFAFRSMKFDKNGGVLLRETELLQLVVQHVAVDRVLRGRVQDELHNAAAEAHVRIHLPFVGRLARLDVVWASQSKNKNFHVPSARLTLHSTKLCTKFKNFTKKILFGTKITSEAFSSISQNFKVTRPQGYTQTKLSTCWRNFDLSRSFERFSGLVHGFAVLQ